MVVSQEVALWSFLRKLLRGSFSASCSVVVSQEVAPW